MIRWEGKRVRRRNRILFISLFCLLLCFSGVAVFVWVQMPLPYYEAQLNSQPQEKYFSAVPEGEPQTEYPPVSEEAFRAAFHDEEAFSLIDSATVKDILKRFGEPISIKDPIRIYTRLKLPTDTIYKMEYPSGVEFWMQGEKIFRIVFTKPDHFFHGKIQIGSSKDEALKIVGPPKGEPKRESWFLWLELNQGNPWKQTNEGTLLIWSHRDDPSKSSIFWSERNRVCFCFNEDKVSQIYLLRENTLNQLAENHKLWHNILHQGGRGPVPLTSPADGGMFSMTHSSDCMSNLKEIGVLLKQFPNSNKQMKYPGLDLRPGCFMFRAEDIYPNYIPNTKMLVCPRLAKADTTGNTAEANIARINDESYWYLGHAVIDENEGLAFLEAYRDAVRNNCSLEDDLTVPYRARSGTFGKVLRLHKKVGCFYNCDSTPLMSRPVVDCDIPVLIERPGHHRRKGGHVLSWMDMSSGSRIRDRFQ